MAKGSQIQGKGSKQCSPTELRYPAATRPRLNPYQRQLSRFYEPLVLLHTLGQTRGAHTKAPPSAQENISYLPLKELQRKFLSELAYLCDFDKGGDTVTAIGLECTPQKFVFWVASNSAPGAKIASFLKSLLEMLRDMERKTTLSKPTKAKEVVEKCISFAAPRIKKYKSLLKSQLRRCQEYLISSERDELHGLAQWLNGFDLRLDALDLCRFAYEERKSKFMRTLAMLGAEPRYKSDKDAIHLAFGLIRHYIGRLGHHTRAADILLSCLPRLSDLLHDFEVCSIASPPKSVLPPPDGKTRLESIIVRMLPGNSPDLTHYQHALAEMDAKHQLSQRFLDTYTDKDLKPRVHAEIQVLEHFYKGKLTFAADDPFIACSKPACFCCTLYFRHHPGHFVEPETHCKVWLNWRPPDTNLRDNMDQKRLRDILNRMTADIRKDALRQIDGKLAPQDWHPDSITGITVEITESLFKTTETLLAIENFDTIREDPRDCKDLLTIEESPDTIELSFTGLESSRDIKEHSTRQQELIYYYDSDDDSEEGGVPI